VGGDSRKKSIIKKTSSARKKLEPMRPHNGGLKRPPPGTPREDAETGEPNLAKKKKNVFEGVQGRKKRTFF